MTSVSVTLQNQQFSVGKFIFPLHVLVHAVKCSTEDPMLLKSCTAVHLCVCCVLLYCPCNLKKDTLNHPVGIGESGHSPDTFSLDIIYLATIHVRRATNTVAVGPMSGFHDNRKTPELT